MLNSSTHLSLRILLYTSKIKLHVYFKIYHLHNKYFEQEFFTDFLLIIQ